jgi:lysophospholipase L1-like esterase
MKTILCYGDSNTYGYDPFNGGKRYPRDITWPGILEKLQSGESRVIEEGLNGRTTGFSDSIDPYMDGSKYVLPCILSHLPLDWIVIMLGTNDCKERFRLTGEEIASSMERLLRTVTECLRWEKSDAKLLLIAPVPLKSAAVGVKNSARSVRESLKLPSLYGQLSEKFEIRFLDASSVVSGIGPDGIHLTPGNHEELALAVNKIIKIQNLK